MIDMPNVEPPTDTVEAFLEKKELAAGKSIVDWGHWCAGTNPIEIPKLAAAVLTGYKTFQVSGAYPHDPRLARTDGRAKLVCFFPGKIRRPVLLVLRSTCVCGHRPLHRSASRALRLCGEIYRQLRTFGEVYTTEEIRHTAVNTLINLQRLTDVRRPIAHTHSGKSLDLVRAAKETGQRVTCAVDPKYYHLTLKDLEEKKGKACPAGSIDLRP